MQEKRPLQFKIGIDARLSGIQHGGIGRYIQNLILELIKRNEPNIQWHLFFHDEKQKQDVLAGLENTGKSGSDYMQHVTCYMSPVRHYTIREQLIMPGIFNQTNLDLLHVPHFNVPYFYTGKMVVTIHDLLWHEYRGAQVTTLPSWQYWLKHKAYIWLTTQAVEKAEKIFVPADTIKKTLTRFYPDIKKKIVVTKEGIAESFQSNKKVQAQHDSQYLLYIGSLYPHKNIIVVLDALQHLPEYRLIVVGARDVFAQKFQQQVKDKGVEKQVQFLGYQPDKKVAGLLQHAQALVQPSLSEGFGLTGLEAMSMGATVICSDIPIFREIYQNGAVFFNPKDSLSFVKAVKESEKLNKAFSKNAQKVSSQYSWHKMAVETLETYLEVLEN